MKSIDLDVRRTFPLHPLFQAERGKRALRRILACYSLHVPKVSLYILGGGGGWESEEERGEGNG